DPLVTGVQTCALPISKIWPILESVGPIGIGAVIWFGLLSREWLSYSTAADVLSTFFRIEELRMKYFLRGLVLVLALLSVSGFTEIGRASCREGVYRLE